MKPIPPTAETLALRTDFSDEAVWKEVCEAITEPVGEHGYRAYVEFVSDPEFAGMIPEDVAAALQEDNDSVRTFAFIIDSTTITDPEHPVQVVDAVDDPGRTFRVIPSECWGVQNNLSIGNMDFETFADAADAGNVFRGFPVE